jgi:L-arabinose isomerase
MRTTQGEATDDYVASLEDGDGQMLLTRELNAALTVMKERTELLRLRLGQGDDTTGLETDLEAIETELARLMTLVEQINRGKGSG